MVFINESGIIGIMVGQATTVTFGSMFATLMFILMVLFAICMVFGIRLEYTAILIFPLVSGYMAYYSEFLATGTVIIIYLSFILTKNFIFK